MKREREFREKLVFEGFEIEIFYDKWDESYHYRVHKNNNTLFQSWYGLIHRQAAISDAKDDIAYYLSHLE